jgi:Dyp-type peroxidase family
VDIQGLVLRGYSQLGYASFLLLQVDRSEEARSVLSAWATQVTTGEAAPEETAINLALSGEGILRLTANESLPSGFSHAFTSGMTTPYRSRLLGDVGEDAPSRWRWGGPDTDRIDVLVLLYAVSAPVLESLVERVAGDAAQGGLRLVERLDTDVLSDREHFGFRDGISQPTIAGLPRADHDFDVVRAGEFLLGYTNEYGQLTERPLLDGRCDPARLLSRDSLGSGAADLGRNGSYLVFRHLSQDVEGFWNYVDSAAGVDGEDDPQQRTRFAAKLVGRWPSGAPLVLSPERDDPTLGAANAFGYHHSDRFGLACPIGSHIRRGNPRDSLEPAPGTERSWEVNRRHRLLRRGRTYSGYPGPEGSELGVHFMCFNANLARQYEFVQHSWINDTSFNRLDQEDDPLIGTRSSGPTTFVEPAWPLRRRHHGVPKFVQVRGGGYFFLPGVAALRYLASGSRWE